MNKAPGHELVSGGHPETTLAPLDLLNAIPEETLWLEALRSPQTRRSYRNEGADPER